jgi:hypothetical protein
LDNLTPFHAGQQAYRDNLDASANPHERTAPFHADDWPGDHANWRDGWVHAQAVDQFTQKHQPTP